MKKSIMKRLIALSIAIVMCLVLVSCARQTGKPDDKNITDESTGKLFDSNTTLSIVIGSHPSYPYNKDWLFWKYLREAVGGTINMQVIPNTEIDTKVTLMMASPKDLPDLIHVVNNKALVDKCASSGALIAIDDYLNKMPNYTSFWNSFSKDERDKLLMIRKSGDGKTYFPQVYGMDRTTNVRAWLYRKDIFEKNGLTTPATMDELYNTACKLKKLYPNSYPICMRSGLKNLDVIGPEWKPYFSISAYYDFNNKTWSYGGAEPTMLEIVKYLIKLRNENLINPDYLTTTTKSWEELVSTNRGFMMPEYQTRIDFFNVPARQINPEFTLDVMTPPKADTPTGQNKLAKYNVDPTGYIICNTGNQTRINNAIKFVDWMYSDKAADLLSWGKKGETYQEVNGKREFIFGKGEKTNPADIYGAQTYGLYLRVLPGVADASVSKEEAKTITFAIEHLEDQYNPVNWLPLNDEEQRICNDVGGAISTYRDEMISKFLLGTEPLSKWDTFQSELKKMGVDQLISVYKNAYERITNQKQ